MTALGTSDQLDCVDAWPTSLDHARNHGLVNRLQLVPPLLSTADLPGRDYDFIYAYSVFTHLPARDFVQNIQALRKALNPGGVLLFTVREPTFLDFLQRNNKYAPKQDRMESEGYWFGNAQSEHYGDTVISPEWLERNVGLVERLGKMPHEGTQIAMKLTA